MKTNFPTRGISCFLVSILLLVSCVKEDIGAYDQSESKIRISFSAPGIDKETTAPTGTQGTTRAALAANTTVRVVAFNSSNSTYSGDQTYFVDSNGNLKPCSVGAGGITINNRPASATNLGLNQPIEKASGSTTLTIPQTAFTAVESSTTHSSAITYLLPRLNENHLSLNCRQVGDERHRYQLKANPMRHLREESNQAHQIK